MSNRTLLGRVVAPFAVLTLVGGFMLTSAPPALAVDPVSVVEVERTALRVRVLQSDMMVAALSCDLRNHYNEAVRRFQAELVLHGRHLRAYFDRVHGRKGQAELDRFVTAMANQASSRSAAQGTLYCPAAERMMTAVLALPPDGLAEFSRSTVDLATIGIPGLVASALRTDN